MVFPVADRGLLRDWSFLPFCFRHLRWAEFGRIFEQKVTKVAEVLVGIPGFSVEWAWGERQADDTGFFHALNRPV